MKLGEARILIVATDGFEEWELFGPLQILRERGAEVRLASLSRDPIQATVHDDPGKTIRPDLEVGEVDAGQFDALILPGGVRNPDQLRMHIDWTFRCAVIQSDQRERNHRHFQFTVRHILDHCQLDVRSARNSGSRRAAADRA